MSGRGRSEEKWGRSAKRVQTFTTKKALQTSGKPIGRGRSRIKKQTFPKNRTDHPRSMADLPQNIIVKTKCGFVQNETW
jgi:hypothetical protein